MLNHILENNKELTPQQVSCIERVFEYDGVIRDYDDKVLGYCHVGASMKDLLQLLGKSTSSTSNHSIQNVRTGSFGIRDVDLSAIIDLFSSESYILWHDSSSSRTVIVLKQGATAGDALKAWYHGLLLAKRAPYTSAEAEFDRSRSDLNVAGREASVRPEDAEGDKAEAGAGTDDRFRGKAGHPSETNEASTSDSRVIRELHHVVGTLGRAMKTFQGIAERLEAAGWDLADAALETRSGTRVRC